MTFAINDIITCTITPGQLAMICRVNILKVADSVSVCYYDGSMKSLGDTQALFGQKCSGCWAHDNSQLAGTASVTAESATVTGTGTVFLTDFAANDKVIIGIKQYTVSSVESDTSMTLTANSVLTESGVDLRNITI